ncbi:DUF4349 domain-containing protein [Virgibacillus sp. DJP39]|uniref:DUF4349 domain-containing protein n=1 Tax=Virgibacillus sp. DJP39 TaxID=3409790 RepID=UPI003BB7E8FC
MKKWSVVVILLISALLVACSSDESSEAGDMATAESSEESKSANTGTNNANTERKPNAAEDSAKSKENDAQQVNRKIIYTANLHILVKNFQKAVKDIQKQVSERGGYIVESNMYGDSGEGSTNGQITARIPQDKFRQFIQFVEEGSSKVIQSSVSGQDVTEEYIDLESRLKSKRVVEKRLLSFMEQAKKTEDLLTISEDLATVQEEIETITGRMKYLQNKSDLATITIEIQEKNVTISGINQDELNTWEKTKQQFLQSINFLIAAFSGIFVFLIGNLPILIVFGIIGFVALIMVKKKRKNNH